MSALAKYQRVVDAADFNRAPQALLLDLIHVFLDYEIPLDRIFFFEASALDPRRDLVADPDSYVRAQIDVGWDYRLPGENGFLYRRLSVELLQDRGIDGLEPIVLEEDYPFTTHGILAQINRYYSVQLRPADVINETFGEGTGEVWLRCAPGSYCFEGELLVPVQLALPAFARVTNTGLLRSTTNTTVRVVVGS